MDPRLKYNEYLKNKHKGGISNSKGNAYEDLYATKSIIECWAGYTNLDSIAFTYQIENAFVDDFKIHHDDGTVSYCQLKNTQKLNWGDGNESGLLFDFKNQKTVCMAEKELFQLKIVYSSQVCTVHTCEIPFEIADVTCKELFSYFESPSKWLQSSEDIQSAIKRIIVSGDSKNFLVNAEAFIMSVMSCWQKLRLPGIKISVDDIKNCYLELVKDLPNLKSSSSVDILDGCKEILDRIENFSYSIIGDEIYWSFKNNRMTGNNKFYPEIQASIIRECPTNVVSLIQLLN